MWVQKPPHVGKVERKRMLKQIKGGIFALSIGIAGLSASQATDTELKIDYEGWDVLLSTVVYDAGVSDRVYPPRLKAGRGTRRVAGNTNATRLEANRLFYHQFTSDSVEAIESLRMTLEELPLYVDLDQMVSNEQLAYWLNLRTIAVVEGIANIYPKRTLSRYLPDIMEERWLTVGGMPMSVQDIDDFILRKWKDPRVIYGFYNGTIAGPSIQRIAYTRENVWRLLNKSGREYVSSLRGIQFRDGTLKVAKWYEQYQDKLFEGDEDKFREHLIARVNRYLGSKIRAADKVKYTIKDSWIADLYSGEYRNHSGISDNPAALGDLGGSVAGLVSGSADLPNHVKEYSRGLALKFRRQARDARVRVDQISSGAVVEEQPREDQTKEKKTGSDGI